MRLWILGTILTGVAVVAALAIIADYLGIFDRFERYEEENDPPMGEV